MPTHTAIVKPKFGNMEHLRRPSVMERVAERQGRHLRLRARQVTQTVQEVWPRLQTQLPLMGEAAAVGLGFGYFHGSDPEKLSWKGVPLELAVGLGACAMSAFVSEKASQHATAIGLSSLASFANSVGRGLGRRHRQAAGLPLATTSRVSGEEGDRTGGGALSDEELARLARRA